MCPVWGNAHGGGGICRVLVCKCHAVAVWDKIKAVKAQEKWLATNEEEYEDTEGNVFNKKTYEDLKRQGLL